MFDVLASRFELAGQRILDLFAGSGALGIEALSRGAEYVAFVEQSTEAVRVLKENLRVCRLEERARVCAGPVSRCLRDLSRAGERFDGVLVDPPYGMELADAALRQLAEGDLLGRASWVMVEAHVDDRLCENCGRLRLTRSRRYGKTTLNLFVADDAETEGINE